MGSKGSSTTSFTPPPEVIAAYREALGYGRAAMGQQYAPYTGEITAPLTPTQESGITNVNRAVGTAIPYFNQATGLVSNVASQDITPDQFSQSAIQQYMSPYVSAVADTTFANLREQQRQEQEALQGQAIRAGAFGGDRAGIAAANMARQQDLATSAALAQIYNQGYGQATNLFGQQQGVNLAADQANAARRMQAAQMLAGLGTGLQGSVLQGAQAQLAAGAQQQAVQQAIASGYYNQYLAAQAYPYQQAQFFANLATGVGGQMGGTTTGTPAQPSPAGSIFGALGALGSIFSASDKRVKENIKPIGKTNDGQTIYRYNFKGDPATQIGLLAQEVEKKHPEAVRTFNGIKGVDYKEATDDSVRSMGGVVPPSSNSTRYALKDGGTKPQENPLAEDIERLSRFTQASNKAANVAPGAVTGDDGSQLRGRFVQSGPYLDVGGGVSIPLKDAMLMLDASYGKVPNTPMKPNVGIRAGLQIPFERGGVVPSFMRHDFALGGGSIDTEDDPMVPYKAGVPARVLQIPKLAKIGGTKPNFGGELPKSPSGPSASDMKGAAEGLGKGAKKLFGSGSGLEDLTSKDPVDLGTLDSIGDTFFPGLAFGGVAGMRRRRRFEDGTEVPETADTITINEDKPIQTATFGDVARKIDAGVPSSEPIREPARDVKAGLLPSMARGNADLPPLFSASEEGKAAQEPEAKPSGILPSMARGDANVPPVSTGVAPAKTPESKKSNPMIDIIKRKAAELGLPENIAIPMAGIESTFNPNAKAKTSSAAGLYGMTERTLRDLGGDYSKVFDPEHNAHYGILYGLKNYKALTSPDDPDAPAKVYMGHFFGTNGAKGILRNPDAPIAQTYSDYKKAVAQNPDVEFKGKPLAQWTGRDAQEWAAAKMAGTYEPRGDGSQTAGLGAAKPVQVASADNKNWPGFGMAGEGKRSIIESLMDKDLDPIQKRALFSFFAGMAASPSPWFGQQLGAGMQAASNVYNESLNKQAELDVQGQRIGLEKERVGLEERRVGIEEKAKGLEVLKYWQTNYRKVVTPDGVFYMGGPGEKLTPEEYNAKINSILKQYNLAPSDLAPAKPGLAPDVQLRKEGEPKGGLVPPPQAAPSVEPKVMPQTGAGPASQPTVAPAMTMPKEATTPPVSAPKQQEPAKQAAAATSDTQPTIENVKDEVIKYDPNTFADVRDEFHPMKLLDEAQKQRKLALEAQAEGLTDQAKEATNLAESYAKKAADIVDNKIPVVFKNGNTGRIPQIEQEQLRSESLKKSTEINVTDNTKWLNSQADAQVRRDTLLARIDALSKIFENYETGKFNTQKQDFVAALRAIGINVPDTATANPAEFQKLIKHQVNSVFDEIKEIGGQVRVAEIQGLRDGNVGAELNPLANRAILGFSKGVLNWENKKFDDAVSAVQEKGIDRFNRPLWMRDWSKKNSLTKSINDAEKSIAVLGGTPDDPSRMEVGQHYIIKPGQFGLEGGKFEFRGTKNQNGELQYGWKRIK